jgi:hypothetical protein
LSKGQLATTVIAGVFGYHAAAKDRGKLDELEMLTRVPLVAFYTIFEVLCLKMDSNIYSSKREFSRFD